MAGGRILDRSGQRGGRRPGRAFWSRHRGALATVIACGIMAVYPDSIQAAKTVLVEPWLCCSA